MQPEIDFGLTLPSYAIPSVELVSDVLDALKGRANHVKETLSSRGDYSQTSEGGGCLRSGEVDRRGLQEACVVEKTYFCWRREYGGLKVARLESSKNWRRRTLGSSGVFPRQSWARRF